MKKIALTLVMAIIGVYAFAQMRRDIPGKKNNPKYFKKNTRTTCPVFYINTSTGLNNNTGLAGVNFDKPVAKFVSVEAGLGVGTWGYKFYLGGKYYFKSCHRGWAIGAGATYCTGLKNYVDNLKTIYGNTETVGLELHSQANALLAAYHYWNIGRRSNRIYVEAGWSQSVTEGKKFDQVYGDPISSSSADHIKSQSPGGPIVGLGFSFGKF